MEPGRQSPVLRTSPAPRTAWFSPVGVEKWEKDERRGGGGGGFLEGGGGGLEEGRGGEFQVFSYLQVFGHLLPCLCQLPVSLVLPQLLVQFCHILSLVIHM